MAKKRDIKAVRKSFEESQAVFALRFGVDQATIHRWETKGMPKSGPARIMLDRLLDARKAEAAE
jgi:DNA-binding transcriptional regulator YiaG